MKYKAICFDVDGTLYSPQQLRQFMINIGFSHPVWASRYNRMRQLFRQLQGSFEEMNMEGTSFEDREALVYMKTAAGRKLRMVEARQKLDKNYYSHMEEVYATLEKQPETAQTLEKIKKAGLTVCVLSDWPLYNKLELMGVDSLVDCRITPYDMGYLKPDVHCFTYMLDRLARKNTEVLFVGDSYDKDITGASAAGIDSVLIGRHRDQKEQFPLAAEVFDTWKDFDAWIGSQLEA